MFSTFVSRDFFQQILFFRINRKFSKKRKMTQH